MLQLGLESGSQPLLDRMGKGTRVADASTILSNLARAGIAAYVYVMLGAPGETEIDAERTRSFLAEHAGEIGFLNLSILNLPREASWPGLADGSAPREGGFPDEDEPLGLYRRVPAGDGWGRAQAKRFLQKRILGDPAIRAIAARTPPWFGDSHAAFFRGTTSGCVASEGGTPFVARRAMNLHGCALPHCAPPPAATPPNGGVPES